MFLAHLGIMTFLSILVVTYFTYGIGCFGPAFGDSDNEELELDNDQGNDMEDVCQNDDLPDQVIPNPPMARQEYWYGKNGAWSLYKVGFTCLFYFFVSYYLVYLYMI